MNNMFFQTATLLAAYCVTSCILPADTQAEVYEVRGYLLGDSGDERAIDKYLSNALLPCLKRHGIGPIGVFTNASTDKIEIKTTFVIIPHDDPSAMTQNREVIQSDEEYQNDAAVFFTHGNQEKSYERISSELLVAMQCWPKVKVPAGILANKNRVYELRTYESANEKLGQLKVEMFNNGEVPIFIDCGIIPIFIGQALVGPFTPNLTYLTVYPSEDTRLASWNSFRDHPAWKVLSKVEKYKGTVSKIHKHVLVPKAYSEM
jgi:hypothetical protein